ncbi:uncharacterized protein KZ484_021513 isoform 2-T2 [Pholidichthys leucotaenia]
MSSWAESSGVSKSDIVRGIITEKLSAAAREILAVVERIVADYEEEASGFRREIDRHRRQLELLQPQVKLERIEKGRTGEGDVDMESVEHHWCGDDDDDVDEQDLLGKPLTSSTQTGEDLREQNHATHSRLLADKRRSRSPLASGEPARLDLQVCLLADSQTNALSPNVLKNTPVQEVQCPHGLHESNFLDLLRSTFPELGAGGPFEIFTVDRRQRLQPLKLKSLTPEEIHKVIGSTRQSALYIRPKTVENRQSRDEEERDEDTRFSSATSTGQDNESFSSPRVQSGRRGSGRPQVREEPTHHPIKIRILNDSDITVVSNQVLKNCPVQEMECPCGLQESEFLDLLRSTFPQLVPNKSFDMFLADRSHRLQPLHLKFLTSDEIYKAVGHSLLYIRLKSGEEAGLQYLPKTDEPQSSNIVVTEENEAELCSSPAPDEEDVVGVSSSQQLDLEPEDNADESEVDSCDVKDADGDWKPDPKKQELDSSSDEARDEMSDGDWNPEPELQLPKKLKGKRKPKRGLVGKLPCKVCGLFYSREGSLFKHAWSHVDKTPDVCGVCGEHFESVNELKEHFRDSHTIHKCSFCGKLFSSVTGYNFHISMHAGNAPFECEVCGRNFTEKSILQSHRWVHEKEKPYKCDVCPKSFGVNRLLTAHRKVHAARERYHCNVCGKSLCDSLSLKRHSLTHTGERPHLCQVCGKSFRLPNALKYHEKIHTERERSYVCQICSKTFIANQTLTVHMKTHSHKFDCHTCGEVFLSKSDLKAHMRVHTSRKQYSCSDCGLCFKRKTHLSDHLRTHSNIKLFVCSICQKVWASQEHLTAHMKSHNREKPYRCTTCDQAFTQKYFLKIHMKIHHTEEQSSTSPSTS